MQIGRIYTETEYRACAVQLEKPGGKRKLQEKDLETEQGKTR